MAKALAENGASVAINYQTRIDDANAIVKEIEEKGGISVAIKSDVSNPDDVKIFMNEVKKTFGKIDILVKLINSFYQKLSLLFVFNPNGYILKSMNYFRYSRL
ncbi:SDR family oxidoreductase [Sporosarcina sp. FA9]|uniref:SDR family oxidoreductase n=1 Tax=Sporosarcina sp. FA9 TaxID=3413030 RepID=UPI003F65AC41